MLKICVKKQAHMITYINGHPSKDYPHSKLLNFSDCTKTRTFNAIMNFSLIGLVGTLKKKKKNQYIKNFYIL